MFLIFIRASTEIILIQESIGNDMKCMHYHSNTCQKEINISYISEPSFCHTLKFCNEVVATCVHPLQRQFPTLFCHLSAACASSRKSKVLPAFSGRPQQWFSLPTELPTCGPRNCNVVMCERPRRASTTKCPPLVTSHDVTGRSGVYTASSSPIRTDNEPWGSQRTNLGTRYTQTTCKFFAIGSCFVASLIDAAATVRFFLGSGRIY